MIQAVHVTKKYPSSVNVVEDVNFTVQEGRIFGLLGPNGAGKTTLMQMISTLLIPTSGDILIYGMNTRDQARAIRRKIGFLTSEVKLDPFSTPDKLFNFFGELYPVSYTHLRAHETDSYLV